MEMDDTFDFRADTPKGRDPDRFSNTLKRYHQLLWSKPLPVGGALSLIQLPGEYLGDPSLPGAESLSSDSIVHTYAKWERTASIIQQVPSADTDAFLTAAYTIGGFLLFPRRATPGVAALNSARARGPLHDRIDLALECIARSYEGDLETPIGRTLRANREFFDLFGDFRGYVEFWLMQDLIEPDGRTVKFLSAFNGFRGVAYPTTVADYLEYRDRALAFVRARNDRIMDYAAAH